MALGGFGPGDDLLTPDACRARATDPATSHEAARRMDQGAAARDRDLALGLIRTYPDSTVPELGRRAAALDPEDRDAEWHRQRIGRRLSELQRAGLIERGAPRDGCSTWHPKGGR